MVIYMYKIMFVDDDPLVIKRLKNILDWSSLGFEVTGWAKDGKEALTHMKEQSPHVVITDINMPNMNGLQFVEKAKLVCPHTQYILLTINDSFGCAQQALNMGVYHYLLKPVEKDKLKALIKELLSFFQTSEEQFQYVYTLENKAGLSEKMIRDKYLNWLVSGCQPLSDEQIAENFSFYKIPIQADKFGMISIHINNLDIQSTAQQHFTFLIDTIINCVENALCYCKNCAVFSDPAYRINILLGYNEQDSSVIPNEEVICQNLKDSLLFELNLPVTLFYSRRYTGHQNIYRCYYETKYLQKYTQGIMDMGIISYECFMSYSLPMSIDFDKMRSTVLKYLRNNAFNELKSYVTDAVCGLPKNIPSLEYCNIISIDLIMTGIMFMQENKTPLRDIFHKYYDPINEISELTTPAERAAFVINFYEIMLDYNRTHKISSGKSLVQKTMELIEQNTVNPSLSVKWLAAQLYMNENYLSRQFHRETGNFLIKYIQEQKLQKAKCYLEQGYSNLQTVAQMSGFSDPLYFSKCFKKRYGVAPSKYICN